MSFPDVTRHMCNIWKSDRLVASMVLSQDVARFASKLAQFGEGARIGNDSVWVKPPTGKEITFHTDAFYVPYPLITCWLTLTDVSEQNGTLQYIPGSHKWPKTAAIDRDAFHAPTQDYMTPAFEAAHRADVDRSKIEVKKEIRKQKNKKKKVKETSFENYPIYLLIYVKKIRLKKKNYYVGQEHQFTRWFYCFPPW